MAMDRRDFLKLCGAAGLVVSTPALLPRRARAQDEPATGPFWVFVHASGGWDPTSLCDPACLGHTRFPIVRLQPLGHLSMCDTCTIKLG